MRHVYVLVIVVNNLKQNTNTGSRNRRLKKPIDYLYFIYFMRNMFFSVLNTLLNFQYQIYFKR